MGQGQCHCLVPRRCLRCDRRPRRYADASSYEAYARKSRSRSHHPAPSSVRPSSDTCMHCCHLIHDTRLGEDGCKMRNTSMLPKMVLYHFGQLQHNNPFWVREGGDTRTDKQAGRTSKEINEISATHLFVGVVRAMSDDGWMSGWCRRAMNGWMMDDVGAVIVQCC